MSSRMVPPSWGEADTGYTFHSEATPRPQSLEYCNKTEGVTMVEELRKRFPDTEAGRQSGRTT